MAFGFSLSNLVEILLFLVMNSKLINGKEAPSVVKCITLKADCMVDLNCYTSAINVKWFCQDLFYGQGDICSDDCRYELGNFTSNDNIGKALTTCSCENDASCLTYRARGLKCLKNNSLSGKTGCSVLLRRCRRDRNCSALWEKFLLKCTHLISGTECTDECKQVRKDVYSHRLMKGYENCECNGFMNEEKFCRGVRAHYDELCKPESNRTNLVEELPNVVEVGTNYEFVREKENVGQMIRSSNIMLGLTVITFIIQMYIWL